MNVEEYTDYDCSLERNRRENIDNNTEKFYAKKKIMHSYIWFFHLLGLIYVHKIRLMEYYSSNVA